MTRRESIFLVLLIFLVGGIITPAPGKCLLPDRCSVSPTSTNTHQFAFSGSTPVHEWDGALNNGSRIDHIGGGVGGKLYTQDGTGSIRYPFHNARGDIMAEFTTGGTMTWHGTHTSGGLLQSQTGTRSSNYGANGKWEEPAGLINDGFRYRDRNTNSFITSDPAGFIDGPNTYNYVGHNPWSAWDPNGLATTLIVPSGTADIGYTGPNSVFSSTYTDPNAEFTTSTGDDMSPTDGIPSFSDLLPDLDWLAATVEDLAFPSGAIAQGSDIVRLGNGESLSYGYADGNPISLDDPFQLYAEAIAPWDPRKGTQQFALYRNSSVGYTDQWGQQHSSICMACHAPTLEAQRNMTGILYGNVGWAIFYTDVALTLTPIAEIVSLKATTPLVSFIDDATVLSAKKTLESVLGAYTVNRRQLARTQSILDRAQEAGFRVDRSLGAGQSSGIVGGVPTVNVAPFSSPTVAIEEYLHASFTQRLINREGLHMASSLLSDPAYVFQQEVRLKTRLIGAGQRGSLGSQPISLNQSWLLKSRAEYEAKLRKLKVQ